jgi:hypothetical protein
MAKKYVNGYDKPKFLIYDTPSNIRTIDLSFKYQALKEYYEEEAEFKRTLGGAGKIHIRYYQYEWRLFYSDYIEKDDRLKILEIEKAVKASKKVVLVPHIDYPWRSFSVIIMPEKKELDLHHHHRGSDRTVNKAYEISFVNADAITELSIADPDYIPVISSAVGEEF